MQEQADGICDGDYWRDPACSHASLHGLALDEVDRLICGEEAIDHSMLDRREQGRVLMTRTRVERAEGVIVGVKKVIYRDNGKGVV
jgi:hypothetical protein